MAELDDMLAARGQQLDHVLELVVDGEVVVERLLARAATQGRSDDTEDVIRHRQKIYADETAPLVDFYAGAACWCASTGSARSTRSPSGCVAALDAAHAGATE